MQGKIDMQSQPDRHAVEHSTGAHSPGMEMEPSESQGEALSTAIPRQALIPSF